MEGGGVVVGGRTGLRGEEWGELEVETWEIEGKTKKRKRLRRLKDGG